MNEEAAGKVHTCDRSHANLVVPIRYSVETTSIAHRNLYLRPVFAVLARNLRKIQDDIVQRNVAPINVIAP
jgi:hypothetical protein